MAGGGEEGAVTGGNNIYIMYDISNKFKAETKSGQIQQNPDRILQNPAKEKLGFLWELSA